MPVSVWPASIKQLNQLPDPHLHSTHVREKPPVIMEKRGDRRRIICHPAPKVPEHNSFYVRLSSHKRFVKAG